MRSLVIAGLFASMAVSGVFGAEGMDTMWGQACVKLRAQDAKRGQLFTDGNYAMFIHWGLYSHLANRINGKTYYGIAEWIMHERRAGIPVAEYKQFAEQFNPTQFNALEIAQLAKDAGMKYIVITAKHHDGFAIAHSITYDNMAHRSNRARRPPAKIAVKLHKEHPPFQRTYEVSGSPKHNRT